MCVCVRARACGGGGGQCVGVLGVSVLMAGCECECACVRECVRACLCARAAFHNYKDNTYDSRAFGDTHPYFKTKSDETSAVTF